MKHFVFLCVKQINMWLKKLLIKLLIDETYLRQLIAEEIKKHSLAPTKQLIDVLNSVNNHH